MLRSQKVRYRNLRWPCDLLRHDSPSYCREIKSYFLWETKRVVLPSLSGISKGKDPNKYIVIGKSVHPADKPKFGRLLIYLSEILSQSVSTAQRMLSQGLLKTTHRKEVSAVSPTPRLPSSSCHTNGTVSCLALMVDTLIRRVSWHELIARLGIGTFKLLKVKDNTHWLTKLIPQSLVKSKTAEQVFQKFTGQVFLSSAEAWKQ